jgi:DNA-binding MarR family transcriptional regulator
MPIGLKDEIGKTGPFESPEQEAMLNCMRTANRLADAAAAILKTADLSGTQYNVLRILRGTGRAMACQEIAGRMITRDADLTRLLDRLENRNLVSRQRQSDDRRVVRIAITNVGLALLAELDGPVNAAHHRLLGHMGKEQLEQLSRLLELAREKADEK